jgi:hypothetical protein
MNPNSGEGRPNFEFTAPQEKVNNEPASGEKAAVSSPENRPQKQSVQVTSQVANDLALPAQPLANPAVPQDDNASTDAADQAKDTDRIEKIWIDRAKAVAAKTQDDPFEQKNQMSRVKADYIRKRFNKTLKVDEPGR